MATEDNEQWVVREAPQGMVDEKHFEKKAIPTPEVGDGEVLLKAKFISVDPYMRGRLRTKKPGDAMAGGVVAEVVASKNDKFPVGSMVHSWQLPWCRYQKHNGNGLNVISEEKLGAPLSTANGVLGMPGMTAYFGAVDVCEIKAGDSVLVSGAAGAVGQIVGQIAKIKGAYVVGLAGSKEKVDRLVNEFGFDKAYNYKDYPDQASALKMLQEAFPKKIDAYFDNVGGHVTDAVFDHMAEYGRVGICGQISMYNDKDVPHGPRFLHKLIYSKVRIRGFVVTEFMPRIMEFYQAVGKWIKEGKLKYDETILDGFDNIPKAFVGLFTGINKGKLSVKVY